jgi:non-ribosomal peptide synthetase component E (peptide arylation enzyme)
MAEAAISPMLADTSSIQADLGMIVPRAAQRFGPKPALVTAGRTLTYLELHDLCDRVAARAPATAATCRTSMAR